MALPENFDQTISILVVDDLPAARGIVVRMLKHLGVNNVHQAGSKQEALSKVKEVGPRVLITDLHLRDGLGTELVGEIKSDEGMANRIKGYIIVTSDMDRQSFQAAIDSGVSSYLLKPFTAQALADKLVACLGKSPKG